MSDDTPPLTLEEAEAASSFLSRLARFMDGSEPVCPRCGRPVTDARKVGRCVYGNPCGCRMYQGDLPKWAKPAKSTTPPGRRGR